MQNDDWVKFGHTIWAKYTGKKQAHILKRYEKAWTEIYGSAPVLENGGPADFLNDAKYTCLGPVPWGQHHEARFSGSLTLEEPLDPTPEQQSSTSKPTSPAAQGSTARIIFDDDKEVRIREGLEKMEYEITYETEFPRIKGGLLDGFIQYLKPTTPKDKLRAIFPIIPQYVLDVKDNKPTCDISAVVLDEEDVAVLLGVEPNCMYRTINQTNCPAGKARYFCNSWVCLDQNLFCFI